MMSKIHQMLLLRIKPVDTWFRRLLHVTYCPFDVLLCELLIIYYLIIQYRNEDDILAQKCRKLGANHSGRNSKYFEF